MHSCDCRRRRGGRKSWSWHREEHVHIGTCLGHGVGALGQSFSRLLLTIVLPVTGVNLLVGGGYFIYFFLQKSPTSETVYDTFEIDDSLNKNEVSQSQLDNMRYRLNAFKQRTNGSFLCLFIK